ncbi:hypothetical protein RSSM_05361 [Rhodopirellula sallentina SM41]|uniref:Uncharacterized protein n=1 Tax=Rhodopirellula sallentina SM41 TaxID=1263870 RepID=M5UB56_9BACT|nr:hypothetical protein RSSM_05361 [Rhodopirellula sallentina SM41]
MTVDEPSCRSVRRRASPCLFVPNRSQRGAGNGLPDTLLVGLTSLSVSLDLSKTSMAGIYRYSSPARHQRHENQGLAICDET